MKCFGAFVAGFILVGLSNSNVIPEEDFKSNENGKNTDTLLLAHIVSTTIFGENVSMEILKNDDIYNFQIYRHGERAMTGSMQLTNVNKCFPQIYFL